MIFSLSSRWLLNIGNGTTDSNNTIHMQRSMHTYLTVHNPLVTLINAIAAVLVVFAKRTVSKSRLLPLARVHRIHCGSIYVRCHDWDEREICDDPQFSWHRGNFRLMICPFGISKELLIHDLDCTRLGRSIWEKRTVMQIKERDIMISVERTMWLTITSVKNKYANYIKYFKINVN